MKIFRLLPLVTMLCVTCGFTPIMASAQAAPVPASSSYAITDSTGNVIAAPPAAPTLCTVTLTLTNTQTPSTTAVAPSGSDRLQTPNTNVDGSAGSKTSTVPFPSRAAVSHDLVNVTDTLTIPLVQDPVTGNMVPIITPVLPMPAGWTMVSTTVFQYLQPLLPGGQVVKAPFQGTMVRY